MNHIRKQFLIIYLLANCFNVFSQTKKINPTPKQIFQYETFTDERDGKIYKSIKIGNQIWMAENLAYLPQLNNFGTSNAGDKYTPFYNVYNEDSDNDIEARSEDLQIVKQSVSYKTYGVLYNYAAANNGCPTGWHLPTDFEWQELELFLGMSKEEINNYQKNRISGSVGKKLKSTSFWENKGNNYVGFNALPAGEKNRYFTGRGDYAEFWGSSLNGAMQCAASRKISDDDGIYRGCSAWWHTKSVRCVKN